MRITIVSGFFLPVPPVNGGSTEKSWYGLAQAFAARGHHVTFLSRRWPGFADETIDAGVHHLRLPGWDHRRARWQNLLLDLGWSWRIYRALPTADIVVVNAVALPLWLGRWKPSAGRVVLMTGRMPKGQYRHYRGVARVLAASSHVREKLRAESRALAAVARVTGYPIDWTSLAGEKTPGPRGDARVVTLGFIGRIHPEKGLQLLAEALRQLAQERSLPAWRVVLCGPSDVARGGSGSEFKAELEQQLATTLAPDQWEWREAEFDPAALAALYRQMDIFCYPSLAAEGETFGVSVAEAMAAGAVPVVSRLACFTDFVRDGETGIVFNHDTPEAARALAAALRRLLLDPALRSTVARAAQAEVRRFDFPVYAETVLADFATLTGPVAPPSSAL